MLTGAEVDQTARATDFARAAGFTVFATADTLAALDANPIFGVLAADVVTRTTVDARRRFPLPGGVTCRTVRGSGQGGALSREDGRTRDCRRNRRQCRRRNRLRLTAARLCAGRSRVTAAMLARLARADVIMFDATLFRDDEMIASGTGSKTGRRMGHMPLDGKDGTLAALAGLPGRRILTHINNTNPVLIEGSPERRRVEAAGFEVAEDGMEIVL